MAMSSDRSRHELLDLLIDIMDERQRREDDRATRLQGTASVVRHPEINRGVRIASGPLPMAIHISGH